MNYKWILFLGSVLFTLNATAVDSSQCPEQISFHAEVKRVFKDSIYSDVPGWKEAQSTLLATSTIQTNFSLVSKKKSACFYDDGDGSRAILSTASFHDPSERNPYLEDQVIVSLNIEGSTFVSFIPVKSYSPSGIELYSTPYPIKIKARLYIKKTGKDANLDLGMISVTLN